MLYIVVTSMYRNTVSKEREREREKQKNNVITWKRMILAYSGHIAICYCETNISNWSRDHLDLIEPINQSTVLLRYLRFSQKRLRAGPNCTSLDKTGSMEKPVQLRLKVNNMPWRFFAWHRILLQNNWRGEHELSIAMRSHQSAQCTISIGFHFLPPPKGAFPSSVTKRQMILRCVTQVQDWYMYLMFSNIFNKM